MGIFGRKKQLNNAAAVGLEMPRPVAGPTTIHNHGTGWPAIIAVSFVCVVALLPVIWWILVFLFEKMGGSEKEAALLVVSIPLVLFVGWLLHWLIMAWLAESHSFKLEMAREVTRREEVRLLAAQTTLEPGRYNEEDYQFARVVLAVMMQAYDWRQKQGGADFRGQWRPWSMRSALETANGIGVKLSRDRANEVSGWLHSKGVITSPEGGQIVTKTFPDLSNVRAMLDREFGKPIVVNPPALRDNRGFEHI